MLVVLLERDKVDAVAPKGKRNLIFQKSTVIIVRGSNPTDHNIIATLSLLQTKYLPSLLNNISSTKGNNYYNKLVTL